MTLRLKSDVHADHQEITEMLQTCHLYDLTIQIGDFGAGFGAEAYLHLVSSEKFKVLFGNHDNYSILSQYPHNMGRFGILEFAGKKIFFVGGAYSIDRHHRKEGISWWPDEELNYVETEECLQLWEREFNNVDLVISHDGPPEFTKHIKRFMPMDTHTGRLLQEIYKIHQPKQWVIGHWHRAFSKKIGNTEFRCLKIGEEMMMQLGA
jgi:hypothetical protein